MTKNDTDREIYTHTSTCTQVPVYVQRFAAYCQTNAFDLTIAPNQAEQGCRVYFPALNGMTGCQVLVLPHVSVLQTSCIVHC